MRTKHLFFLAVNALLFTASLSAQQILTSFENDYPLSKIVTSSDMNISRSKEWPALGKHSLRVIFPMNGGNIHLNSFTTGNWTHREVLLAFIWTNTPTSVGLSIVDSLGNSSGQNFQLQRGANHLQFCLQKLKGIDTRKITSISFQANQADTLFFDYLALDRAQPALDDFGRWDYNYTGKVKSPHISWGNPLSGEPILTFSISPVFDGRGIIELAERLEIKHKVTTIARTPGVNRYGFGDFYTRRNPSGWDGDHPYSLVFDYIAEDLLFGPEYDVIIWPGLHPWTDFPEVIRKEILQRVENGTGLVLIFPMDSLSPTTKSLWGISPMKRSYAEYDFTINRHKNIWREHLDRTRWSTTIPHYITKGVALDAFPWGHMGVLPYKNDGGQVLVKTAQGNPVLSVRKYGKGRIVAMAYPDRGLIPWVDNHWETGCHNDYWEYLWSLLARSVVWAANREPQSEIRKVNHTIQGITIDLSHVTVGTSLRLQLSDAFGVKELDTVLNLKPHQEQTKIIWPYSLKGGPHIVNVQLKGAEGIYDWYSLKFSIPKIAEIDSIHLIEEMVQIGENVKALVSLNSNQNFKGTLMARLFDNYKRLLSQRKYLISAGNKWPIEIILSSSGIKSHLANLDLVLRDVNGNELDHRIMKAFICIPRNSDGYDVTMYGFQPNPIPGMWPLIDSQFQKLHVTTLAAYTLANSKQANYKILAQTRISGVESPDNGPDLEYYREMKQKYLDTHDKMGLIRKYGLHDPVYLDTVRNELERKILKWRKFSPSKYYIYEEPSLTRYNDALDLSFSERSLQAMRAWLKTQYGTLQALNEEWGSQFSQWREVIPDDYREAQQRGNYASWADHRTFMEISWAGFMKYVQMMTHYYDPGGLVQLSGSYLSTPFNGYDYSRMDKYIDHMNAYKRDNQLYFHNDFNPALQLSGRAGYGALGKVVLYDYYHHLFLGITGSFIFWQISALRPDLTISKSGQTIKNGLDELKGKGIGKLVNSFNRSNQNRIVIEYSMPSVHATWIVDGKVRPHNSPGPDSHTFEQFRRDRDGWVQALQDAGLGFDFISYNSIEDGGLITKGYQTLILPMNYALSDREVKQIKYFVQQGGTVIADALPGIMDGHAKFREKQALAEVFGIEPRAFTPQEVITPTHQTRLVLKGGHALAFDGQIPEIIYHKYGQGTALLLNYFLDEYPQEKQNGNNAGSLQKVRKFLKKLNIQPGIKLMNKAGQPTQNITKFVFANRHDQTQMVGLLPNENTEDQSITLHLTKEADVYDVRNEKYLGRRRTFEVSVQPYVPHLYGLLQGRIEHISVSATQGTKLGESVDVTFDITGEGLESLNSVAHIEVFNPDGEKMSLYSKNVGITRSIGSFHFKTALNDPAGKWTIRVKEVMSGIEKTISVNIH